MQLMKRYICIIISLLVTGCGIEGMPLSPSQVENNQDLGSHLPFGVEAQKKIDRQVQSKSKKYASIGELNQLGYDYEANFGLENQELEDIFERITPKSGQPQPRIILPLKRNFDYE